MLLIDAANVVGSRPTGALAALAASATEEVVLVSADRSLGDRVRRRGGELVGPRWLFEPPA